MAKKKTGSGNLFPNTDPNNLIGMVESRYNKMTNALDRIDDLLPENATDGSSADLNEIISQLIKAQLNISELIAYRKLLGVD